jgi:plastocyanin
MSPSRRPSGARLAASLAAVVIAVGGCAGSQTATVAPVVTAEGVQRVEVAFAGGAVTGGMSRYAVPVGSTVEVVVASDVADEVHLHGYDRAAFVTAGATATLRFVADLPGVYEVELEQRGTPLAQLEVS